MNLLELQRRMSEDVRRPLTADFEMQSETEDGELTSEIADSYIKPNDLLSSFERLEIYNRQYWFRVIGAVSEDFPALNAVMGGEPFDELVLAYLRETPSVSFSLRDLGAGLPDWLARHPELAGEQHELAVDVARLEWAYVDAYDGGKLAPLSEQDFGSLGAESTLRLQPHLRLLDLQYPVDELVLAVRKETPEADVASNAAPERRSVARPSLPEVERSPVFLAVHRYDDLVYYRRIDREAFRLLFALQNGDPIGEAIEKAFAGSPVPPEEHPAKIQEYFAHAAELGWFCRAESR